MRKGIIVGLVALASLVATPSHAFILLLLAASRPPAKEVPPTLRERPSLNPGVPLRPEGLPAPYRVRPVVPMMPAMPDASATR